MSSVFSKGQGGANFEFRVQAAFLTTMMIDGAIPMFPEGKLSLIRFQSSSKGYGFLTDDIFAELYIPTMQKNRKLLAQIKHNVVFSEKDESFQKIINAAWHDFNRPEFDKDLDTIVVIKGNLSDNEFNHLIPVLNWPKYKASYNDYLLELQQSIKKQKYFKAIEKCLMTANGGKNLTPKSIWSFLKCFNLIRYDFTQEGGHDYPNILNTIKLSMPDNSIYSAKEIWDAAFDCVSKSDSMGGSFTKRTMPESLKKYIDRTGKVNFFVHHKHSPPLSFDYFYFGGEIIKTYTEDEFKIRIAIENNSDTTLILDSLSVKTLSYTKLSKRVLRLNSPKGLFTPEKFVFRPCQNVGKSVELLNDGQLFSVKQKEFEVLVFELGSKVPSGFYHLEIIAKGTKGEQKFLLKSNKIPLTVSSKLDNRLYLTTMKFFEAPIKPLLELDEKKWKRLKAEKKKDKYALFLGQTIDEQPEDIPFGSEWKIKGLKKKEKTKDGYSIDSNSKPKVFATLGIPVSEDLFGLPNEAKASIEQVKNMSNLK